MHRSLSSYYYGIVLSLFGHGTILGHSITQEFINQSPVITVSGTWSLQESIVIQKEVGLTIIADDVTVDLNGNSITGSEITQSAIIIKSNNCTIKNGSLKYYNGCAIILDNAENTIINNTTVADASVGICLRGGFCNQLKQIKLHNITNLGIDIVDSPYFHLQDCALNKCTSKGIFLHGSSNESLIEGISIDEFSTYGLHIASDNVQCIRVIIQNGDGDGVILAGNDIVCSYIQASHNSGTGFLVNGTNTVLRQCGSGFNGGDGIILDTITRNIKLLAGSYSANNGIGVHNKGTANIAYAVDARGNGKRDMLRIFNSLA